MKLSARSVVFRMMASAALVGTLSASAFAAKPKAAQTATSPAPTQASSSGNIAPEAAYGLMLGTAWYPEQWPESRWDADLTLMEQAHIHWVRVGEFAWSTMEPSEGVYHFGWLEHAIALAAKHHIQVVLGTPSAAPPAWLTQKYPETLRTLQDGRKDQHGNRQQFDWSDPKYREFTQDIATRMAEHFGHNPNVIGWQIGNEFAAASYGPDDQARFDQWLKGYYGTLDNLNQRWTTAYWSQTYSNWDQIPIETNYGNPGLLLSWMRFVSDTWRSYQRVQLDAIRAHSDPRQFITTNMMGFFDGFNYYTIAPDLSLISWDDYVGSGHLDPVHNGAEDDLNYGMLGKDFWIMETQPAFVNWHAVNSALAPGETRAMAWHNVAHGADAIGYWQWRSALNGQEQYHGTLLGPDGTPVPLYPEVAHLGADFEKAGPVIAGTSPHADVAILYDYESRWAIDWQRHNRNFDPINALLSYYGPLRKLAHTIAIVPDTADLSRYKLVVAPALNLLTPQATQNLIAYVRGGGHLVLGQRSGMKDVDDALYPERQPGPLVSLLGGRVSEFYALLDPAPYDGVWGSGTSQLWGERLSVKDPQTQVLMRFGKSNGWLDGQPAAITRVVGKGRITYIGAWLDQATMARAASWMLETSGVKPLQMNVPDGVEFSIRSNAQREVWFFINLSDGPQTIALPQAMTDVLNGGSVSSVSLDRYGVAVLSRDK